MRRRIRCHVVSFAVMLAALAVSLGSPVRADEPNDTLGTATSTGLTGAGRYTVTGYMGNGVWPDRDVDLYSLEVSEGAPLIVRCTVEVPTAGDTGLDGFLRLFGSSGIELANGDDDVTARFPLNPRIETYLLEPGVYYVGFSTASNPRYDPMVGGSGRAGPKSGYTLTIAVEAATLPDSPFEPNDHVFAASQMGSESFTVTGEFIGDGAHGWRDVDIYSLALNGPARVDVEVHAASIGSLLDPVVRLRNCEEAVNARTHVDPCLLAAGDDAPDGSADPVVSAGVLTAQIVYIMVSGAGNRRYYPTESGSGEIGSTGYYDLVVSVTHVNPAGPNEPNDSIDQAVRLPLFAPGRPETIEVAGYVGDGRYAPFQGDRDFFEVTAVDEVRFLTVDVAAESIGSGLDPVVLVYANNALGSEIPAPVLIRANDNYGESQDAHLVVPLGCVPTTGLFSSAYVVVMGTKQRPPTDPRMPWSDETVIESSAIGDGPGSTGPYRLTLYVDNVANSCSNEPDDTIATATDTQLVDEGYYVCAGGEIGDGECEDPWTDADMWSVEVVRAPAILRASVSTCRYDAVSGVGVYAFDAEGELLASGCTYDYGERVVPLVAYLPLPGTYYVGVNGDNCYFFPGYDPLAPCYPYSGIDLGTYDLAIELTPGRSSYALAATGSSVSSDSCPAPQLFATRLDTVSNQIDVIDPVDGVVTATFDAPEPLFGGSEGLAYDGSALYFIGTGRYPRLYQLDPADGHVIDEYILWVGSGYYSDATMLGGLLYLLDYREGSVHVIDPIGQRFLNSLMIGYNNGVSIAGGLAALAGPNRLYVADAFKTQALYEVDPQSGLVTDVVLPPRSNCCTEWWRKGCDDANCAATVCSTHPYQTCCAYWWGPTCAQQANAVCDVCTVERPVDSRPVALGGIGSSTLYVADWEASSVETIDREGNLIGSFTPADPVGSLAGDALANHFADFDLDGDIDLADFAAFQSCYTGPEGMMAPDCDWGDRDCDGRVDLTDFADFLARWFEP